MCLYAKVSLKASFLELLSSICFLFSFPLRRRIKVGQLIFFLSSRERRGKIKDVELL